MPLTPTYPGVYIEEMPSSSHAIAGVSTSNTAFIDYFARGPVGEAVRIASFTDFERYFGGLDKRSEASYQIMQYYLNGGQIGYVVRLSPESAVTANVDLREENLVIPSSITLGPSEQQQFTATISGGVNWSIAGAYVDTSTTPATITPISDKTGLTVGTIDSNGIYTAPASIDATKLSATKSLQVTVTAQCKTDCGTKATATITLTPVEVTVTPSGTVNAGPGEPVQFRASVIGSLNQKVKWFLYDATTAPTALPAAVSSSKYGTIDSTGLYTAPSTYNSATKVGVAAAALGGPAYAVQPVTLVAVAVTPAKSTIATNQSLLLTAYVDSSVHDPSTVTWSADAKAKGPTFCFNSSKNATAGEVTVTATAGTDSGTCTVKVVAQYSVSIQSSASPESDNNYHVEIGDALEFSAITAGDPSNAVTWTASAGAIDEQGVYRAPASLPSPEAELEVTVTATSANDTNSPPQSASVIVVVEPPASRIRAMAASPGVWGNNVRVAAIQPRRFDPANPTINLQAQEVDAQGNVLTSESYTSLSYDPDSPQYIVSVINDVSSLIRIVDFGDDYKEKNPYPQPANDISWQMLAGGEDGAWDAATDEFANAMQQALTDDSSPLSYIAPDLFNILCIPATSNMDNNAMGSVLTTAQTYCQQKRAFLIADIPNSQAIPNPQKMAAWFENNLEFLDKDCAAVYYPRVLMPDPRDDYRNREVGYSGTLAGIYATTDTNRGIWKAPAGTQFPLSGVSPVYVMKDSDNGVLNPLGINAIRSFPVYGVLSWGARTLRGADELADQWKYIPVRRMAQYIENSLYSGLTWAVFEPNDTPLWASIVQNVNAFMSGLFRQGAFQGSSPKDAYFVTCDSSTTTQTDIDLGRVNVIVGFAPLKPAEFVIVQIQQMAGAAS